MKYTIKYIILFLLFSTSTGILMAQTADDSLSGYVIFANNEIIQSATPTNMPISPSLEQQGETLWLNGELGGTAPLDIIFANNKYYVYGYHRIVVLDATSQQKLTTIDISDYGKTYPSTEGQRKYIDKNNLAYNPSNGELYCITADFRLICINTSTDEVIDEIFQYPNFKLATTQIIKYDARTNQILTIVNYLPEFGENKSRYHRFDATTHEVSGQRGFDFKIYSMAVNAQRDRMYISAKPASGAPMLQVRKQSAGGSFLTSTDISTDGLGKMLYIDDAANNVHKTICFQVKSSQYNYNSYPIYSIDGNNDNISTSYGGKQFTASVYNPDNAKFYAAYQGGFRVFNANTNSFITDVQISTAVENYTLDMEYNSAGIIVCSFGKINGYRVQDNDGAYTIDCSNNSFTMVDQIPDAVNYKVCLNPTTNTTAITSFNDGTIYFLDGNGQYNQTVDVGGNVRRTVYCDTENKVYSYSTLVGKLFVNDFDNGTVNIIDIGNLEFPEYISSVVYDKATNHLFVSVYSNSNLIKVIDCASDAVLSPGPVTSHTWIKNMFISNNGKLYANVGQYPDTERVNIFDVVTFNLLNSYIVMGIDKWNYNTWYADTKDGDVIMVLNDPGEAENRVWIIDGETNTTTNSYVVPNPVGLAYNPVNDKIYTRHTPLGNQGYPSSNITVIDRASGNISYIQLEKAVFSLEYCNRGNNLAAFGNPNASMANYEPAKVWFINGQDNQVEEVLDVPNFLTCIKYNPYNGNLYALSPFNLESGDQNTMEVWNLGRPGSDKSKVTLDMHEKNMGSFVYIVSPNQLTVTTNNKILVATGHHSRINTIDCESDKLTISPGWNWISIPRLVNNQTTDYTENDPTVNVFEPDNFEPGISDFYFTHDASTKGGIWPQEPYGVIYDDYTEEWTFWPNVELNWATYSYWGMIFQSIENTDIHLHMSGNVKDPNTGFPIYENQKNWIGYFLPETQDVFDALANNLDDIEEIWHQDFYCYRPNGGGIIFGPEGGGHTTYPSSEPEWACDNSRHQIEYGEMIKVRSNKDLDDTTYPMFIWSSSGSTVPNEPRPETDYYTFTEKASYKPIIIELDSTDNPMEIGAFVGDSCVGACSVIEADTAVILLAYLDGLDEDSIVFQEHYSTKSSGEKTIKSYVVLDEEKGIFVKRTITKQEGNNRAFVSFKKKAVETSDGFDALFNIWPNPSTGYLNFSFLAENSGDYQLLLFDINGRLVTELANHEHGKGMIRGSSSLTSVDGGHVKPGIYFVKLRYGGFISTKKLMVQ